MQRKYLKKENILTIPNLLSLIRILLIPFIIWLYCAQKAYLCTIIVIALSGFTDIIDGKIARKFNMVSDVGKVLDPVADKLTQATLVICLIARYPWMWALLALFAVKECLMLLWGYLTLKSTGTINGARWYGKLSTVVLYAVMMILILFVDIPQAIATALMLLCGGMMLAVILYLVYVLCTGVLPFMCCKSVSDTFAASVTTSGFFSDTPCTDKVALVEYPTDSFDARIHILDEAKERIDVSYYAMHMGKSTDLFLGALLDAADRGVNVRILLDGQFGGLTCSNRTYATAIGAHPNIELKLYNPPKVLKPWTWNGRLHDKYIIIDDRLLLMGGRNIGDKYFATEGYDKPLSYDRDVLIYNTVQAGANSVLFDVRNYMDSLWNSKDVLLCCYGIRM